MSTLALIPARGGSKGVPRKNLRTLAGLPLVAHAIRCAQLCPEVTRIVVTTDDEEIAATAREHGAETPFLRPAELAQDETPMWPVVRHAVEALDDRFEHVLLLDPTSPARLPEDVARAHDLLRAAPAADGVIGVSEFADNPLWVAVVERQGRLARLFPDQDYARRQDVPRVLRINASLYLWRTEFVRREEESWLRGELLACEIPERRAVHVDEPEDMELLEALLAAGLLRFPWLAEPREG